MSHVVEADLIRRWARAQKIKIPDRGRIPLAIADLYQSYLDSAPDSLPSRMTTLDEMGDWDDSLISEVLAVAQRHPDQALVERILDFCGARLSSSLESRVTAVAQQYSPSHVYEEWHYWLRWREIVSKETLGEVLGDAAVWTPVLTDDVLDWLDENATLAQAVQLAIVTAHPEVIEPSTRGREIDRYDVLSGVVHTISVELLRLAWPLACYQAEAQAAAQEPELTQVGQCASQSSSNSC